MCVCVLVCVGVCCARTRVCVCVCVCACLCLSVCARIEKPTDVKLKVFGCLKSNRYLKKILLQILLFIFIVCLNHFHSLLKQGKTKNCLDGIQDTYLQTCLSNFRKHFRKMFVTLFFCFNVQPSVFAIFLRSDVSYWVRFHAKSVY